jgi:TubC N-terminal docking domain
MTTIDLLTDFRNAGVELFADSGRIRCRAPAGALTASMREAAANNREELLALLAIPDGWDSASAAVTLTECETAIDAALASAGLTAPQRSVAEVLRDVIRAHATQRDPLLFHDRDFLAEQFARWRTANVAPAPRRKRP